MTPRPALYVFDELRQILDSDEYRAKHGSVVVMPFANELAKQQPGGPTAGGGHSGVRPQVAQALETRHDVRPRLRASATDHLAQGLE